MQPRDSTDDGARGECPQCGQQYQRLSSHWSHPNTECDYPDIPDESRQLVAGLVLAAGSVSGNGQNRHVRIGTVTDVLAEWTADRLGWLCQSVRSEPSAGDETIHVVRTVAHPDLNRYERWPTLPDSDGRRPPEHFALRPLAARTWWAYAGGLEWAGPYNSQRRGVVSAKYDDRAKWIRDLLDNAGVDSRRADRRVVIPPSELATFLQWAGDPVPGVEYKWAASQIEYRALREMPATEMDYVAAVASNALTIARKRVDGELTPEAFESTVDVVSASVVADVLGGGDWDGALVTAGGRRRRNTRSRRAAGPSGDASTPAGRDEEVGLDEQFESPTDFVKRAAAEYGEPLTKGKYLTWRESVGAPHHDTLLYHSPHGTWTELCEAAGVAHARSDIEWRGELDESDTGDILRRAADECGEPLAAGTYQQWASENGYPSHPTLFRWAGVDGWLDLCDEFGIETPASDAEA